MAPSRLSAASHRACKSAFAFSQSFSSRSRAEHLLSISVHKKLRFRTTNSATKTGRYQYASALTATGLREALSGILQHHLESEDLCLALSDLGLERTYTVVGGRNPRQDSPAQRSQDLSKQKHQQQAKGAIRSAGSS